MPEKETVKTQRGGATMAMPTVRGCGLTLIILGVMAFIGSAIKSEIGVGEGFIFLLILAGIGGLLVWVSGAKNRKYRRLGEQTNSYYEQIKMQPPREPSAQAQQQTAVRIEPPPTTRSQSLEAGLFDE